MNSLDIAKLLINAGCVKLSVSNPFTYASGLKGPIYCDNRLIWGQVEIRKKIIDAFIQLIKEKDLKFDSFCGLATAGIPHGAILSHSLDKPFTYVRSKSKSHGKRNCMEGHFEKGDRTILVEDLVNQGSSLEKAIISTKEEGLNPVCALSVVDYQTRSSVDILNKYGLSLFSLTNLNDLLDASALNGEEKLQVQNWHKNPENWS